MTSSIDLSTVAEEIGYSVSPDANNVSQPEFVVAFEDFTAYLEEHPRVHSELLKAVVAAKNENPDELDNDDIWMHDALTVVDDLLSDSDHWAADLVEIDGVEIFVFVTNSADQVGFLLAYEDEEPVVLLWAMP